MPHISPLARPRALPFLYVAAAWLCIALGGLCLHAQGFQRSRLPVPFATGWLVHAGDDPAYARPDFDDSHWVPFNAETQDLHNVFPGSQPKIVWYRLHIKVAPDDNDFGLLEKRIFHAFEVYSNGAMLIRVGTIPRTNPISTWPTALCPFR